MEYKVNTSYNSDMIVSELGFDDGNRMQQITRDVINLRDQDIRDALIALGWTPPTEPMTISHVTGTHEIK